MWVEVLNGDRGVKGDIACNSSALSLVVSSDMKCDTKFYKAAERWYGVKARARKERTPCSSSGHRFVEVMCSDVNPINAIKVIVRLWYNWVLDSRQRVNMNGAWMQLCCRGRVNLHERFSTAGVCP